MHHFGRLDDAAAQRINDSLVSQADAQDRHGRPQFQDGLLTNAEIGGILGLPGPGETMIRSGSRLASWSNEILSFR